MGKRDSFWENLPYDDDGQVRWPESADARESLVRSAFGARVIGALEAVLDEHLKTASGQRPEAGSPHYERENARREVFAQMSDSQRREVARLVNSACFGTLYWILVKLEHFPLGEVDFKVEPYRADGTEFPQVGIEEAELHHLYFDWVDRFSDHGDGSVDAVEQSDRADGTEPSGRQ